MTMRALWFTAAIAMLAGCAVETPNFVHPDAGPDGGDGPTERVTFVMDPSSIPALAENTSTTFTLHLQSPPTGNVTVKLSTQDTSIISVSPEELVFGPADSATPRTITVTAPEDDNATPNTTNVIVEAGPLNIGYLTVTVADNDVLQVLATPDNMTVVEERTGGLLDVALSAKPSENVEVTVASADATVATVDPPTLTFTPDNWSDAQQVTVTGVTDDDTADDNTEVLLTATEDSRVVPGATVNVRVTDDDRLNIVLDPGQMTLEELNGGTGVIGVSLTQRPTENVVVQVETEDALIARVSTSTLTFTRDNFDDAQPVTVTAQQDANVVEETTRITFTVPAIADLTAAATITVNDDDQQVIVLDRTSLTVGENASAPVKVKLAFQPEENSTVTLSSASPTLTIADPETVTFTPENYNVEQEVDIRGLEDLDVDDHVVAYTVSGPAPNRTLTVTVDDNDSQAIVTNLVANQISMTEGNAAEFTVRLAGQPRVDTTVTITSPDPGAVETSPATLRFTPANYNTPQPVTVTAPQDDDVAAESVLIGLTATNIPTVSVTTAVTDNDTQELIVSSAVSLTETGTGTFQVQLKHRPSGTVPVTLSIAPSGVATLSTTSLSFNATTWSTPQSVTVTGVHDDNAATNTTTISVASAGLVTKTLDATVTDVDPQAIQVTPANLTVVETNTNEFRVRLAFRPTTPVTVNVASGDESVATVTPETITFTSGNYSTEVVVEVRGVNDADAIADQTNVSFTATGLTTRNPQVNVTDNDSVAIEVSQATLTVAEQGTASFQVKLTAQPTGNVTVALAVDTAVATLSDTSLQFTPSNFGTNQSITVTGVNDVDLATETVNITLTGPSGVTGAAVSTTVTDNDTQRILLTPPTLTLTEGTTTTFDVELAFQPANDVVVTLSTSPTGVASLSSTSLTFTPGNYSTGRQITVTALHDDNLANGTTTIKAETVTAGVADETVSLGVTDDDKLNFVMSRNTLSVAENGTGNFTVRLSHQPASTVTTTISITPSAGVATFSPSTISFNSGNWNSAQQVNVTPVVDTQTENRSVEWKISAAAAENDQQCTVTVTNTTQLVPFGWKTLSDTTANLSGNVLAAYQVQFDGSAAMLDGLGIVTTNAGSNFRMALYKDAGGMPTDLVFGTSTTLQPSLSGETLLNLTDVSLPAGTYWLVLNVVAGGSITVGKAAATDTTTRCTQNWNSSVNWPSNWGTAGACSPQPKINIFGRLYRNP